MKERELELRMYGLVPYNISPIQQGIQHGHAVVEYGMKYFKDKDYQDWAKKYKTFIILSGGTTNNGEQPHKYALHNEPYFGSMQKAHLELMKNKIKIAVFYEPDMNDTLSAICFLVDERVFNKEKYPEYDEHFRTRDLYPQWLKTMGGEKNIFLREFLKLFKLA